MKKDRVPRKLKKKRYKKPSIYIASLKTKLENVTYAAQSAEQGMRELRKMLEQQAETIRKLVGECIEHKREIERLRS